MNDQFWVNGDMHILFNNGAANAVRLWNTPTAHDSKIRLFGIFAQDTWSYKKLTLNLGVRVDRARGWMPEQSKAAGTFSAARDLAETDVFDAWRGVWRTGVVYDLGRIGTHGDQGERQPLRGADRPQHGPARAPVPAHQRHAAVDRCERRSDPAGDRARRRSAVSRGRAAAMPMATGPTGRTRTSSPPASSISSPATFASARPTTTAPTG